MLNILTISLLTRFFPVRSQKGVTMIEYALIAALVAVLVIGALTALQGGLTTTFTNIAGSL
jgi:pilus assembly protein Flp/PilA